MPIGGNVRKPGVLPWRERKSSRGKRKTICTAGYACPRPDCDYFGNTDSTFHALVGDGQTWRGWHSMAALSSLRQTLFQSAGHGPVSSPHSRRQVAQVLLVVNLGLTLADTAWLFHHSEVTLRLWLSRAGQHAEKVHAHFFQNLTLGHLQLDELFTTLRDKAHDLWGWTACDPVTKLIPALQLGPRTQDMAYALIHALVTGLGPRLSARLYQRRPQPLLLRSHRPLRSVVD